MPRKTYNRSEGDWFFDQFDSDRDRVEYRVFKFALIATVTGWIVGLALLAGVIYVAVHFLGKVW